MGISPVVHNSLRNIPLLRVSSTDTFPKTLKCGEIRVYGQIVLI